MGRRQVWSGHSVVLARVGKANGRLVPVVITDNGEPLISGIDWLTGTAYRNRSSTQVNEAAHALGLLYDFYLKAVGTEAIDVSKIKVILSQFADALAWGTINPATGDCPFGLHWKPLSYGQARRYATHAERYCMWLFSDERIAVPSEQEVRLVSHILTAWEWQSKAGGLLSHLQLSRRSGRHASAHGPLEFTGGGQKGRPTPFPEELVMPLLLEGCRREHELKDRKLPPYVRTYNVRNQLAFLAILGLGLRSEELFHLYATDVYPGKDGYARVNLYHPVKGSYRWTPPGSWKEQTVRRIDYLRDRYGLQPRNLYNKKEKDWAGWKSVLLEVGSPHYYARGYWIDPVFGLLFQVLHRLYIQYHRSLVPDMHPYYFVSLDKRAYGEPWTMKGFQNAWQSAIEKIGKFQSRSLGTNPHGGRHYYGQRAADMGIDPRIRQIMMHHVNIASQLAYQMPSPEQVSQHLQRGQSRMMKKLNEKTFITDDDGEKISTIGETELEPVLEIVSRTEIGESNIFEMAEGLKTDPLRLMTSWKLYRQSR